MEQHESQCVVQLVRPGSKASDAEPESDYEAHRQQQLARNRAKLEELGLGNAAASLVSATKQRNAPSAKRPRPAGAVEPAPRRESLRVRKIAADPALAAGIEEDRKGRVVLAAQAGHKSIWSVSNIGEGAPSSAGGDASANRGMERQRRRYEPGPLPLRVDDVGEDINVTFLAWLRQRLQAEDVSQGAGTTQPCVTAQSTSRLQLISPMDVAKLTQEAVTHMAWHPSPRELLIAAGDKTGQLSLWQVDRHVSGEDQADDEFDGVALFSGIHRQYVSALAWVAPPGSAGGATQLFTASYDGSLRILDVEQGQFLDLSKALQQDTEISAAELDTAASLAYVADKGGGLEVVDLRSGNAIHSERIQLHDLRINCLHLEPTTRRLLCSASTDALVKVWDVRQLGRPLTASARPPRPLCVVQQVRSCHSALWAPDGSQRVLSLGYDDTVRVWAPAAGTQIPSTATPSLAADPESSSSPSRSPRLNFVLQPQHQIKHDNQTGRRAQGKGLLVAQRVHAALRSPLPHALGHPAHTLRGRCRWVLPFRAIWGPDSSWLAVGSMKRGIDVYESKTGRQVASLHSELMTAIPSRLAAHTHAPVLAATTNSGRVHVWRVAQ